MLKMEKICSLLFNVLLIAGNIYGQNQTVAVIPAEGASVSQDIRIGVTNGLQEGVFNSGKYTLLARGEAFEKALSEMQFQQSGTVSDNQLTEFGHAMGANFVCYATLSKYSETSYRISYKMIAVASGEIVNMGSETVRDGVDGLLTATDAIAKKIFGNSDDNASSANTNINNTSSVSDIKNNNFSNGAAYNPDGIKLVYVAGANSGIAAIKSFFIGMFEITQTQWQTVMGSNPSIFKGSGNLPVEFVSWNDIQAFLSRLNSLTGRNYRLPTITEWEFAAHGGTTNNVCPGGCQYSGSNDINSVAWYGGNSGGRTHDVGTKQPNELGIYDMTGNVWEWCEDWYDSSQKYRIYCGGGWFSNDANCQITYHNGFDPDARNNYLGFRVVLPQY